MKLFRKKINVPNGEQKELDAVKTWIVRWESRYGSFLGDTKPECEVFTSEEDARHFKEQLDAAYKLLRHISGTKVTMQKNN